MTMNDDGRETSYTGGPSMTPERWQRIEKICTEALAKDPAVRGAFLNEACAGDLALREEVDSLLRQQPDASAFLKAPADQAVAFAAAAVSSSVPERIGSYRVLRRLGAGGMGEVFLAECDRLHRRVAIKRVLPSAFVDAHAGRRLLTEARAAARLDHPHICPIFEVGEDEGAPFIVMPVVEGETLESRLRSGPLSIVDAVDIAAQVAEALGAAHERGVLHRDIKPANLMIGAGHQVRVMDFGLARFVGGEVGGDAETISKLTATGSTIGTAAYMSPEQARGDALDPRSDLFTLGIVLYEMVAGRRPFAGKSFAEIVASTLNDEPASLVRQRPDVPDELQRIVSKALRKSRDERYPSAGDLLVDLRTLLHVLRSGAHPAAAVAPPGRRWWIAAAAVVVLGAMLASWWILSGRRGFGEAIDSVVVLPLVNDTGDPQKDYIADAITDSLIRDLSQLPNLKVIGRQTAFQFKGKTFTPQQIGKTLSVRAVMTGRLQRAGDDFAIDVELGDARDGSVIISRQYLEPAAQAARIETDITGDLVRDLRVTMSTPAARELARVSTTSGQAYQLHLRARFLLNLETPEGYRQSLALNQQAVAADPTYVNAWIDQAEADFLLGAYFDSAQKWMPEAKIAALQALRVDPNSSGAHIMLGLVALVYDWDMATAERELAPSIGLEPGAMGIFTCSVHLLESLKKHGEADHELQRAIAVDPMSGQIRTEVGCNAYYERRYEAAVEGYRAALEIDPRNMIALWGLGRAYGQLGQYDDALAALAKIDDAPPIIVAERGYALARAGKTADARRQLDALTGMEDRMYVDPYFVAEIYAGLGDGLRAQQALEAAYRTRSGLMAAISTEPKWDFIRRTPAFVDLQKRVGL